MWGDKERNRTRSGLTRAVSQLCLVTSKEHINQREVKQHFNVIDNGNSDAEMSREEEEMTLETIVETLNDDEKETLRNITDYPRAENEILVKALRGNDLIS